MKSDQEGSFEELVLNSSKTHIKIRRYTSSVICIFDTAVTKGLNELILLYSMHGTQLTMTGWRVGPWDPVRPTLLQPRCARRATWRPHGEGTLRTSAMLNNISPVSRFPSADTCPLRMILRPDSSRSHAASEPIIKSHRELTYTAPSENPSV